MPQGGIDENEDPYKAALRELYEETNIRSVEKLGEIAEWLAYDIPRDIVGQAWGGKYRGQKQKWYALRFTGDDGEIDIVNPGGGHEPEFIDWRWVAMGELPDLVVPFKRQTYERVVQEFEKVRALRPSVHRRAGQVPVDGLEVIEPRDQLVELGAGLRLLDAAFQFADARRDHGAVDVFDRFGHVGEHGEPLRRHFGEAAEHDDLLLAAARRARSGCPAAAW